MRKGIRLRSQWNRICVRRLWEMVVSARMTSSICSSATTFSSSPMWPLTSLGVMAEESGDFASAGVDGEEVAGEARAQARFALEGAADARGEVVHADDQHAADGRGAAGPVQFDAEQDEALDEHDQQDGEEGDERDGARIGRPVEGAHDERERQRRRQRDGDAADDARQLVAEGTELRDGCRGRSGGR